jgi:glycosyltransferase involved in cell wall biosynthesis
VARLLSDPDLAASMGQAGRERLVEHFGIERLTEEFLEEYALARAAAQVRREAGRLPQAPPARR